MFANFSFNEQKDFFNHLALLLVIYHLFLQDMVDIILIHMKHECLTILLSDPSKTDLAKSEITKIWKTKANSKRKKTKEMVKSKAQTCQ